MGQFNFGKVTAVSSNKPLLAPWKIHEVTLTKIEKVVFTSKKNSKEYTTLQVRFDNKEGYYTYTVFYPVNDSDAIKPEYENPEGHKYKVASNLDVAMAFVAQIAANVNPEGWKAMQEKGDFKDFDQIVSALIKITKAQFGKFHTKLKLIGKSKNGTIHADLPKFVAVRKDDEQAFTSNNFIGECIGWTPYEDSARKNFNAQTPTAMSDDITAPAEEFTEDLDLESLDF